MQPPPFPPGPPPFPPNLGMAMPPPPPGFFPRRGGLVQDPLSSVPHQTYQAHRASRLQGHPSLPPNPTTIGAPVKAASTVATVSAEPELRDFKKEATAFVPSALKRKAKEKAVSSAGKVNAAPSLGPSGDETEGTVAPNRPDLVSTLRDHLPMALPADSGTATSSRQTPSRTAARGKDDYEKFVEEMGDILGA
jgi:hypothetical protein